MTIQLSFFIFLFIYSILITMEVFYSKKHQLNLYDVKDSILNVTLGVMTISNKVLFGGLWLAFWVYLYQFAIFKIDNSLWVWILMFFANEFVYYWFHRCSHQIRIFWAVHVNHHSSEHFNLTTAGRLPFFNIVVQSIWWAPLVIIGFDPVMVLSISQIGFAFGIIQHSQMFGKLPGLEYIFNTPTHHKIHHASNPEYINHNYGNVLIIFDRIFGTFVDEDEKIKIRFGITKNIHSYNPLKVIFHEWVDIFSDFRSRLSR